MKQFLILLIFLVPAMAFSQMLLKPGNPCIEYKRISDETSNMIWYLMQDTTKIEIGRITSDIQTDSLNLTVITTVRMRQAPTAWIDSTIADRNSLKPVYHSSYNTQRDMIIRFDSLITGYYADKEKRSTISISDSPSMDYFDSNLYPTLIRWLPLKTGFTKDLSIYDFNPNGKTGVMKVSVIAVRQCEYIYQDKEIKKVYLVTVKDEISSGTTTYFIDIETRKLWKMVIASGERKMVMEAV
ncbi:DUF3108 domain-containing protein [Flavitalea sp.]|nr:hypothetical protein [Flavitalea sp.]